MWFKYFNRQAWAVRLFRGRNMKFDNNSYGFFRYGYSSKLKNTIYKMVGNEGGIRILAWAVIFPMIGVYVYISEVIDGGKTALLQKAQEAEDEIKMKQQIEDEFFKNR